MLLPLGFGVGLRPAHYPDFHAKKTPNIDWLEVISENFMGVGGRPRRNLEKIRADYPIATHGVSLGIAGMDPLNERYLKLLKELIDWLEPSLVTDHICWTSWKKQNSFDLLPFPYNEESLQHVCSRVQQVQDTLGRRILLENPSAYIDFLASDRHEPEFLNELCKRTGCGLILDLNNCMVNSKNLGWDPEYYIHSIQPEHVGQFHLAGHTVSEEICIDTHSHPVPDEVWQLYQKAVRLFPGVPTLIEWDDELPSLERLGQELDAARHYASLAPQVERRTLPPMPIHSRSSMNLSEHQELLFKVLRREQNSNEIEPLLNITPALPKFGLRAYVNNHFAGQLEAMKAIFSTLYRIVEDDAMASIVDQYTQRIPSEQFSINNVGDLLPTFLMEHNIGIDFGVPQALIAELASFDAARNEFISRPDDPVPPFSTDQLTSWSPDQWDTAAFVLRNEYKLLQLNWDILTVYLTLENGEHPDPPAPSTRPILMTRSPEGHVYEPCPENIQSLLQLPAGPFTLVDLVEAFRSADETDEQATERALDVLIAAIRRSMIGLKPD